VWRKEWNVSETETARVRPLRTGDLELILEWRNHASVRACMLTQHEISLEEHRGWFERASADPGRWLLLAEDATGPFGYVGFSRAVAEGIGDWGFYVAPGAPKGSGRRLGHAALSFAFEELALYKVCGQALAFNEASIAMHTALGFRQEGVLRDQHRIARTYHDIICFGLLRHEWTAPQAASGENT
jgi:UDP-4-amino-4,6-dideoxy-N-acetyl-beta-L-altrosamine N-acetyltransferase